MTSAELGKKGEDLAVEVLEAKGYRLLDRNYRFEREEVDLVMFEPTPGRGSESAAAYTGWPAEQDESGPTAAGGEVGEGSGLVPQPTAPSSVFESPTPTTVTPGSDGVGSGRMDGFVFRRDLLIRVDDLTRPWWVSETD